MVILIRNGKPYSPDLCCKEKKQYYYLLIQILFNDDASWDGVSFMTPMEKGYTFMLPDGTKKEKEYSKELIEELSGRPDYPTILYREEFEHE